MLQLDADQPAFLIMDVFKGQMTSAVMNFLKDNNVFPMKVPANMANLYQPLDLRMNGYDKSLMKRMSTEVV